jgi:hypothetical protein
MSQKKIFIRLNITPITTSKVRAFQVFLRALSVLPNFPVVGLCTLSIHQKER